MEITLLYVEIRKCDNMKNPNDLCEYFVNGENGNIFPW